VTSGSFRNPSGGFRNAWKVSQNVSGPTFHPSGRTFQARKVTFHERRKTFQTRKVPFHECRKTFQARKVTFHERRETFQTRKVPFHECRKTFQARKVTFHGRRETFQTRKVNFHGRRKTFQARKVNFHERRKTFQARKVTFHGRWKTFQTRHSPGTIGIRARCGAEVKGICLTGFGMEEDMRQSREADFLAHLTKPVSLQELEAVLQRGAPGAGRRLDIANAARPPPCAYLPGSPVAHLSTRLAAIGPAYSHRSIAA
jgi:hypothetical protein